MSAPNAMPKIAIVGRPNVGKSSLFNRLVGRRVSIVDPTPGVTRDRVEGVIELSPPDDATETEPRFADLTDTGGYGVYVGEGARFDDAGEDLADLTEAIESQIRFATREADLVIFLLDARTGVTALDERIAAMLRPAVTVEQAETALSELLELGLLVEGPDGIGPADASVTTPHEVAGLAAHNYHAGMIHLAQESLTRFRPFERHLTGLTVGIPAELVADLGPSEAGDPVPDDLSALVGRFRSAPEEVMVEEEEPGTPIDIEAWYQSDPEPMPAPMGVAPAVDDAVARARRVREARRSPPFRPDRFLSGPLPRRPPPLMSMTWPTLRFHVPLIEASMPFGQCAISGVAMPPSCTRLLNSRKGVFCAQAQLIPHQTFEPGPPSQSPPSSTPIGPRSALPPLSLTNRISVLSSTSRSRSASPTSTSP